MEETASQGAERPALGVGMVGYAFMGAAHSQAWRTAPHVFDLPLQPGMAALCGRDAAAVGAAARRLGWAATEKDWHDGLQVQRVLAAVEQSAANGSGWTPVPTN